MTPDNLRMNSHRHASKRTISGRPATPGDARYKGGRAGQHGALEPPCQAEPAGGDGTARNPRHTPRSPRIRALPFLTVAATGWRNIRADC